MWQMAHVANSGTFVRNVFKILSFPELLEKLEDCRDAAPSCHHQAKPDWE
jgi:hypothetical protein